jgi:hypothetical protein
MPLSKQDKDIGEHIIYAHLLFDDQARASKAVNSLPLRDHDIGAKHTDRISPKQKKCPQTVSRIISQAGNLAGPTPRGHC